jgi:hypothetical protein
MIVLDCISIVLYCVLTWQCVCMCVQRIPQRTIHPKMASKQRLVAKRARPVPVVANDGSDGHGNSKGKYKSKGKEAEAKQRPSIKHDIVNSCDPLAVQYGIIHTPLTIVAS